MFAWYSLTCRWTIPLPLFYLLFQIFLFLLFLLRLLILICFSSLCPIVTFLLHIFFLTCLFLRISSRKTLLNCESFTPVAQLVCSIYRIERLGIPATDVILVLEAHYWLVGWLMGWFRVKQIITDELLNSECLTRCMNCVELGSSGQVDYWPRTMKTMINLTSWHWLYMQMFMWLLCYCLGESIIQSVLVWERERNRMCVCWH